MLALPADTRPAKYCRRAEASVRNNMALKAPPNQAWLWDRQGRQDYTVYSGGWEAWKAWAKMEEVA